MPGRTTRASSKVQVVKDLAGAPPRAYGASLGGRLGECPRRRRWPVGNSSWDAARRCGPYPSSLLSCTQPSVVGGAETAVGSLGRNGAVMSRPVPVVLAPVARPRARCRGRRLADPLPDVLELDVRRRPSNVCSHRLWGHPGGLTEELASKAARTRLCLFAYSVGLRPPARPTTDFAGGASDRCTGRLP